MMESNFSRRKNDGIFLSILVGLSFLISNSNSFVVVSPHSKSFLSSSVTRTQRTNDGLWMGRKKGLGDAVDMSNPYMKKKKKKSNKSKKKTENPIEQGVSSKLADWAASAQQQTSADTSTAVISEETGTDMSRTKKKPSSERRLKQSQRMAEDNAREEKVGKIIEEIENTLKETKNDISDVLSGIRRLRSVQQQEKDSVSLRKFLSTEDAYRLTWVGSEDAVTHMGTGLQNVPLARLEDVFLRFLMKGKRVEVLEVIRILGPFPNVRNTLLGDINTKKSNSLSLVYDSMIDGTGKEILAGNESKKKQVDLEVLYAGKNAFVFVVPPSEEENAIAFTDEYIFRNNGENLLFFSKVDDLDEELAKLRVN